MLDAERRAQRFAGAVHGVGIDLREMVADNASLGSSTASPTKGRVEAGVAQGQLDRFDHRLVVGRAALELGQQRVEHQLLHRLVAGEGIVIVGREEGQIGDGAVRLDDNGRRESRD
jgi:hypothetical protein